MSLRHSTKLGLQKSKLSSAKNKWLNRGLLGDVGTPVMKPLFSTLKSNKLKVSGHNKNKKGDIGPPYRSPLDGLMLPIGFPFTSIE